MRTRVILFFAAFILSGSAFSQAWTLVSEFDLKSKPDCISSDYYKNIVISDLNGVVYKYDSLGKIVNTYSPGKKSKVTLLESGRNMNIFLFYENFQEYVFLDRFFNRTEPLQLTRERVGFARTATVALDNNLWVFDDLGFSLKKFNTRFQNIDLETPLNFILDPSDYEITFLREYQNQLFIADTNSGILVFDNLGIYKTKLPYKGVTWFGFVKDEMYFIQEGELVLYNLYTYKERRMTLPVKSDFVLLYEHKVYVLVDSKIMIYTY